MSVSAIYAAQAASDAYCATKNIKELRKEVEELKKAVMELRTLIVDKANDCR